MGANAHDVLEQCRSAGSVRPLAGNLGHIGWQYDADREEKS
jgi:hypothetical protein